MTQGQPGGPTDPLIGRTLAGRYLIRRPLGRGGMGAVYEAEHVGLGRRLAVKLILERHADDHDAVERFHREARTASRIGNPHIIQISDVGRSDDGQSFIAMEYLDGSDLGQVLRAAGALEPGRAIHIMEQVLVGLDAAHAEGIVHRDLKPENVFLTERGGVGDFAVLMDFGISKVLAAEEERVRLTHTGVVVGTPIYMAPEQALGEPTLDHRVDLYAAGVMLYEMLAGRPPFAGTTYAALVAQHLTEPPPFLAGLRPGLPPGLVSAVHRALEKRPDRRFATAHDLRAALLSAATELPDPATQDDRPTSSMTAAPAPPVAGATPPRGDEPCAAAADPASFMHAAQADAPGHAASFARAAQTDAPGRAAPFARAAQADPPGRAASFARAAQTDGPGRAAPFARAAQADPPGHAAPFARAVQADPPGHAAPFARAAQTDPPGHAAPFANAAPADVPGIAAPVKIDVPVFRPTSRHKPRAAARMALLGGGVAAALAVGVWRGARPDDDSPTAGGAAGSAADPAARVATPADLPASSAGAPASSGVTARGGPSASVGQTSPGGPATSTGAPASSGGPATSAAVLEIDSGPRGAHVFVDGVHRGRTPVRLEDVAIGDHRIRLELRGYQLIEADKAVRAGTTETFFAALARRGSGHPGSISTGGRDPVGEARPEPRADPATAPPDRPPTAESGEGKTNPYLELRRRAP